jgi:1-acyl-sn-glycerol-3-phosphate acyltransferase
MMFLFTLLWVVVCVPLLPWRVLRIKACNYYGKAAGRTILWLSGCPLTVEGWENLDRSRPALYVSNHTSLMDIFLAMWISPVGTVGIAKKQVVWYPFLGQLYLLSGHLRIDRDDPTRAVESLKHLAAYVREHGLSVFIWPEGTRSRDGRLLPFKKGVVHLAVQTGLPIVPIVVEGAQQAWIAGTLLVRRVPITIRALEAIDTTGWTAGTLDGHLAELHDRFRAALPESQQPVAA